MVSPKTIQGVACIISHCQTTNGADKERGGYDIVYTECNIPRPFDTGCLPLSYSGNPGAKWRFVQGCVIYIYLVLYCYPPGVGRCSECALSSSRASTVCLTGEFRRQPSAIHTDATAPAQYSTLWHTDIDWNCVLNTLCSKTQYPGTEID